ncbi:MAG: prolyl aminopeptidase [Candidatus Yanofskybacteria bacterium]|nr:prolyl aminopeptidase [Candidatus Yanofskybacteria bacterium]
MTKRTKLYPSIKPLNRDFLKTDDGHKIYFEECGNPDGVPVLFFHGGPGAGCGEKDRRYFDPKKWRIILFDQRGCGRSRPLNLLENNTTWHLIQDAKRILDRLNITKTALFGGSWGSTMALAFAITYPNMVLGMVLRGIFLGESSEIDYSENGLIAQHFPRAWERFASVLPPDQRKNPLISYHKEITAETTSANRKRKLAYEWARYEDAHLCLTSNNDRKIDREFAKYKPRDVEAIATLELHYIANGCFFRRGFVLNNVSLIPDVPISIVHGEYDVICPPKSAHRLEKALSASGHTQVSTFYTFAGHSKSDPETQERLLSETELLYKKVKTA